MFRARSVAVAIMLAATLLVSPAAALNGGVAVDGTITVDATDGPEVDLSTNGGELVLDGPDGKNTVVINHTAGNATFSSQSPTKVGIDAAELTGTYTRATSISAGSTNLTINPADKRPITVGGGIDSVEFQNAVVDDSSTDFSYSATSTALVEIETSVPDSQLVAVDAQSGSILDRSITDGSGTATFGDLDSGSHDVEIKTTSTPTLKNPQPTDGSTVGDTKVELSIDVSDADFDDSDDSVTVTFYDASDDSQINKTTISKNQTVSTTWSTPQLGVNKWYVKAVDSHNQNTSTANLTVETPNELRIYNESNPSQLIDSGATFRVRAYADDDVLLERTTSDGTLSLDGFPTDKRLILTVAPDDSNDFTYRRIVVDDITETQSVYLLNKNQPSSRIIFSLDDPTGKFPPESTRLYIERPITKDYNGDGSNETRYQVIAGDTFGSVGEFPAVLQTDTRYRLRVESDLTNQSRILGAYSVSGSQRVPLQIQRISPSGEVDEKPEVYGGVEGETLAVRYFDPEGKTDSVEYRVIYGNGTVFVPNTTRQSNGFADIYSLPNTATNYTVEYTIKRGSTIRSGSFDAGRVVKEIAPRLNVDSRLLEITSYLVILASMALVVLVNSSLAPITGTGVAAMLTMIGTVAIPSPILGIAGAISVLLPFGRRT